MILFCSGDLALPVLRATSRLWSVICVRNPIPLGHNSTTLPYKLTPNPPPLLPPFPTPLHHSFPTPTVQPLLIPEHPSPNSQLLMFGFKIPLLIIPIYIPLLPHPRCIRACPNFSSKFKSPPGSLMSVEIEWFRYQSLGQEPVSTSTD